MEREKFARVKNFLRRRGFVIALAVSVGAVGITTYCAYAKAIKNLTQEQAQATSQASQRVFGDKNEQPVNAVQENVPRADKAAVSPLPKPFEPSASAATTQAEKANVFVKPEKKRLMPVNGEVTQPFSGGELVKSETLDVWKTHDGADIAADLGTTVKSAEKGKVADVYGDPLWGVSIVVEGESGTLCYYTGLSNSVLVSAGQDVVAGEPLGSVGNSAEIEISQPPHLHFAVKEDGAWVDPVVWLAKE